MILLTVLPEWHVYQSGHVLFGWMGRYDDVLLGNKNVASTINIFLQSIKLLNET